VDDFINAFNTHRADNFQLSDLICVDESMSRWYSQGGNWINHGLPQYICIDRKPENGCEIQNAACGRSGVMMQLRLVKSQVHEENNAAGVVDDVGLPHGASILKKLVLPWAQTDRIVCADSYFASVATAAEMKRIGLRFIGVVKTATRQYPMAYLSRLELTERGEFKGLVTKAADGTCSMLAFVWMDRDRRYFIANASSLEEGEIYVWQCWCQVNQEANAAPTRVQLNIRQPKAAEIYYQACAMIDRHNRCRQDDLCLERKLVTHKWSMRVNMSIFAMIVVDTWLVYRQSTKPRAEELEQTEEVYLEKQKAFYSMLAEELIDNNYDAVSSGRRARSSVTGVEQGVAGMLTDRYGQPRSGIHAHLTPTKRKRKQNSYCQQGRCKICGKKTTLVCSLCNDNDGEAEPWLCGTKQGRNCFATHMTEEHEL